jgi:hypothetical protein
MSGREKVVPAEASDDSFMAPCGAQSPRIPGTLALLIAPERVRASQHFSDGHVLAQSKRGNGSRGTSKLHSLSRVEAITLG